MNRVIKPVITLTSKERKENDALPYTTNATVHLYSNYPLPEARVTEDEKQLGRARLIKDCLQLSKDRLQLNQNTEVPTVNQRLLAAKELVAV